MSTPTISDAKTPNLARTYTDDVKGCARCEGDHDAVKWTRFTNGPAGRHTHWGICPTTGDPILMTAMSAERTDDPRAILEQIWELEAKLIDDEYIRDWCFGEYAEQ